MKYLAKIFGLLAVLLVVTGACSNSKNKKTVFTPTSSGRPYEVLVVVDQGLWERPAGRALFHVLDTDVPGLPQSERSFRISDTDPRYYDQVLKIFRNIIIVDIQDIYTQPKLKYATNVHAVPQMIMTIQAPDEESFREYVSQNGQTIIDFFVRAEMNRQVAFLKEKHSVDISTRVKEMFGCDIWLPAELISSKAGKHFLWFSTNAATADMNFVMYSYPYRDKDTFTKEYYMHKRDSVMKVNIPGAQEGMYMATDTLSVEVKDLSVNGGYVQEARGLWQVEGDMMGGPFVAHSCVDTIHGCVVVAEVFVYSPDKLKRDIMRRLEASLYTLKLPSAEVSVAKE